MTGDQTERLLLSFPDDPPFLRALFPESSGGNLYLGDRLRAGLWTPSLYHVASTCMVKMLMPPHSGFVPNDYVARQIMMRTHRTHNLLSSTRLVQHQGIAFFRVRNPPRGCPGTGEIRTTLTRAPKEPASSPPG
jgi:hypothetical protein